MIFGNRLFFKGCTVNFVAKDIGENYKKILRELGIDFIEIDEELCCGYPLLNAGAKKEYEEHKKKVLELFKEYAVKEIVSPCPTCSKNFKDWGLKAFHITELLYKNLNKLKKKIKKKLDIKVYYHDPCHLGRYQKIFEEPREILKLCVKEVLEFKFNREFSICCGGGGLLRANYPEISREIAALKGRLTEGYPIVTCCPMCYVHLKENSGVEVFELSEILIKAMGL